MPGDLKEPGWYPDAATGGTRYWDGAEWTGDTRPFRRAFAARSRHLALGIGLVGLGSLLAAAGLTAFWMPEMSLWRIFADKPEGLLGQVSEAIRDIQGVNLGQAAATFASAVLLAVPMIALGVYLLRGRGPTTWSTRERLAERAEASWLAQRQPTSSGWYPNPDGPGTAYWSGKDWTGDTRPPRRTFAAEAADRSGIVMVLMGGGGFGLLAVGAAYEDGFSLGWLLIGAAVLLASVLWCAYTWRGRGPTTREVESRLAASEQAAGTSAGGGWRLRAWQLLSDEGRAQHAYARGDSEFQVTLQVDDNSHVRKLREIESHGWRRVGRRLHPATKESHVTPLPDGGHRVERTSTQEATYFFERDTM